MKTISINDFVARVKSGEINVVENTEKILEEIEKSNRQFHHFCLVSKDAALRQAKELGKKIRAGFQGKLLGVPLSVKDSICVKGVESRAGSKVLSGFIPQRNATVVKRALDEGAVVVGKTSQDEFGFGSYSVNVGVGFEVPKNPFDATRSCGGSSGGSAGFSFLTKFAHASFGESTGGSIVCPASFCGVAGFTPTYGLLSRSGLIDYGNSLDKIGPIAKTVEDAAIVLDSVAGADPLDSTTVHSKKENFSLLAGKEPKGKTIGVVKEFCETGRLEAGVEKVFFGKISALEKEGFKVKEVSLALNEKFAIPAYYLVSTPEASTNLARYCGMRYGLQKELSGNFNEYFSGVRSEGFGLEVKRRLMLGTFARMSGFRDAYYLRALKVRSKLLSEFSLAFKKVDLIVHPTMPFVAPAFEEIKKFSPLQHYYADLFVCPANLAGFPHVSVNAGFSKNLPVGFMFTAPHFGEKELISAGSFLEAI
ncbi:MAG: amidase family protein [archaeon]